MAGSLTGLLEDRCNKLRLNCKSNKSLCSTERRNKPHAICSLVKISLGNDSSDPTNL